MQTQNLYNKQVFNIYVRKDGQNQSEMNKKHISMEIWNKVDRFLFPPTSLLYLDYTSINPIQLYLHYKGTKTVLKVGKETQTAQGWAARQVAGGVGGSLFSRPVAV